MDNHSKKKNPEKRREARPENGQNEEINRKFANRNIVQFPVSSVRII